MSYGGRAAGGDLKIMTRGGSDTDLEPSEEFPILFGLLTAPMTNSSGSNGTTAGSASKSSTSASYLSKLFRKATEFSSPNEPDSSALSDEDVCISEDDDEDDDDEDYTSYTDTDEDDGSEGDSLGRRRSSDDAVVSSNSTDQMGIKMFGTSGAASRQDDIDRLPSSTTMDDEDYDDILLASHTQGIIFTPRPNSNKALKRSYHHISCLAGQESRSAVQAGGAAAAGGGDTEEDGNNDEEVKSYCFNQHGLEKLRELEQPNRLASSPSSGSSPQRLERKATEDFALLLHQQHIHSHHRPLPTLHSPIINPADPDETLQPVVKRLKTDQNGLLTQPNNGAEENPTTPPPEKNESEMCAGFSFANEKTRPTATQKVAQQQPNPVDGTKSFNTNVVSDNSAVNALIFNSNNNNNNTANSTLPLLPNRLQEDHPTDNSNNTGSTTKSPSSSMMILSSLPAQQHTASNESNTKTSPNHDPPHHLHHHQYLDHLSKRSQLLFQTEGEEQEQETKNDEYQGNFIKLYKCIHCDLMFEERHMLASHCCKNLDAQK